MKRLFYCLFALLALVSCKDDEDKYPGMKPFYEPDCEVFRDIVRNCGGKIQIGSTMLDVSGIKLDWPESWGSTVTWVYVPELNKYRIRSLSLNVPYDTTYHAYLPESIAKLDSLNSLWITGWAYRGKIPYGLGKLPLKKIYISRCSFDELPEDFFTDRLVEVGIHELPISKIPESIANLRSFPNELDLAPWSPEYPKLAITGCKNLIGKAPSTPYARVSFSGNSYASLDFNSVLFDTVFDPQGRKCYRFQTLYGNQITGSIPDSIVNNREKLIELIMVRTRYQNDGQNNSVLGFDNIPEWFFEEFPGMPWKR